MKCDTCKNTEITYYRQMRKDGKIVVTARCKNGHHPTKGKPFYPLWQFKDITKLPMLPQDVPYKNYPLPLELE